MEPISTVASDQIANPTARNRRFEILAQADALPLHTIAEAVLTESEHYPVVVVTPPRSGVLMLRHREPVQGTVFNAGEILVTEAAVTLAGHAGYAMRLGREPETTLAAAILDAAVSANHPLTPEITDLLHEQEAAAIDRDAAAWREIAPTRVAFEEMHQ